MPAAILQIATCSKCNGTKSAEDFYRDLSAKSGLMNLAKVYLQTHRGSK